MSCVISPTEKGVKRQKNIFISYKILYNKYIKDVFTYPKEKNALVKSSECRENGFMVLTDVSQMLKKYSNWCVGVENKRALSNRLAKSLRAKTNDFCIC